MSSGQTLFTKLLESTSDFAITRIQDQIDKIQSESYLNLGSRVEFMKEFGTIRLAIGRYTGQTTSALKFISDKYRGVRVLFLSPRMVNSKDYPDLDLSHVEFGSWHDVGRVDPRGIRLIFVDPGPHAGPVAKSAIYQCAAEAMVTKDQSLAPVVVFFIGT